MGYKPIKGVCMQSRVTRQETRGREEEAVDDTQKAKRVGEKAVAAAEVEAKDADLDALLDNIDDLLEENAQEFVEAFIQKGGQ
jgi:ubiquitin-like protein Pup